MSNWKKSQTHFKNRNRLTWMSVMFLIIYANPAYAYLDPGTGSIILQGLIAGLLAIAAAGGAFWQRIKSFFAKLSSSEKSSKKNTSKD